MKKLYKILILSLSVLSFILGLSFIQSNETKAFSLPSASTYKDIIPIDPGDDPINTRIINTVEDLSSFASTVNAGAYNINAVLMDNIDLSGRIWTPIGNSTYPYRGVFDGNGFIIKNMLIDSTINKAQIGLFGVLGEGAKVKDVVLENAFIQTNKTYIGAVVGEIAGANVTIKNVAVSGGQINHIGSSSIVYIGGIVGNLAADSNNTSIANSYSDISINTLNSVGTFYIGGLYGRKLSSTPITFIYNAYFTGQVTTLSSYVNGLGNNPNNTTFRNVYFSFLLINDTTTQAKATIINFEGKITSTITAQNLRDLTIIYSYFNKSAGSTISVPNFPDESNDNLPLITQENWIKNEGEYPQLRGVGNKVVAVKQKDTTADYATSGELLAFYLMYQNLKSDESLSTNLTVYQEDSTLDEYKLYRKTSQTSIIEEFENKNRLTNESFILTTQPGERQGYYVFEITTIKLLHEQQVVLKDLANFSNNFSSEAQVDDNIKGIISFYNESGELFTNTTKENRGREHAVNTWAELNYTDTAVKIFTTRETELTVHAYALDYNKQILTYYHSMFLHTTTPEKYSNSTLNNSNHRITLANDIEEEQVTQLTVCLSDLYAITFNQDQLFDNNITIPTNYGGNEANISSTRIYISRKDGKIFNKYVTGDKNGLFKEIQKAYPIPVSTGYVFDGWFSENKVYRFSKQSANEQSSIEEKKTLMDGRLSSTYTSKEYYEALPLVLYGYWNFGKNNVSYTSILSLNTDFGIGETAYYDYWSQENWTIAKTNDVLNNSITVTDVAMSLKINNGTSTLTSEGEYTEANKINTTSQISITAGPSGAGYNLKAILIIGLNDLGNITSQTLLSTSATFASDFSFGNSVYYSNYIFNNENMPTATIYHLHGDLMIYAIYDRGIGEVTARFDLTLPESVKETIKGTGNIVTGFELSYDVYEIGDTSFSNSIKSGVLSQTDWQKDVEKDLVYFTINGLKAGQTIKIKQMTLGNSFVFETNNEPESRINADNNMNGYNILISYEAQEWTISKIIKDKTAALNEDKTVYFSMGIRYKGLSIGISATTSETDPVNNVVSDSYFSIVPLQDSQNKFQVLSKDFIDNLQSSSTLILKMEDIKRWVPILNTQTGNYKIVITNESGNIIGSHDLTLTSSSTINEYYLEHFSSNEFIEGQKYFVYIVVAPQQYTIEISRTGGENVSDKLVVFDEKKEEYLTFTSNKAFVENITYDQLNSLSFVTAKGYKISEFKLFNTTRPVDFIAGLSAYKYDFALFALNALNYTNLFNNDNSLKINVTVEALKTDYKVEYYKESLVDENNFELFETEIVEDTVLVGQTKTITINSNKYTGFQYVYNENEVLSTVVIFAENGEITTFKVFYARKTYTVVYNGNGADGGIVPTQQDVKYGHSFTISPNTTTKTGFNFVNWNTNTGGTGHSYLPNTEFTMNELFTLSAITTLYAIWQEKTINITYLSQVALTAFSNSWINTTGYITFSDKIYAVSSVKYSKAYGFINGISYSTLPTPSAVGYIFAGWWTTLSEGGQQITATSTVSFVEDATLYARWNRQSVTIEYDVNLSGVSLTLSYTTKTLYVGDTYSLGDTANRETKLSFPTDSWISSKILNLKGWALVPNPSVSVSYLTEQSVVPAGQSTIRLYAHWEVVAPTITTQTNWAVAKIYNHNLQKTLEVTSSTGTYISNHSGVLTYSYTWYKSGVVVNGQTGPALYLQNVADSGQYTVRIDATHSTWGTSNQSLSSGVGTVTINPMQLTLNTVKVGDYITKVYDDTMTVKNVTTSNSSIISAFAVYDNENVGNAKQITFTINYNGAYQPNNFAIYYESNLIENPTNLRTITFSDNSGQITKYALNLTMGNLSNIANGLQYRIEASALAMNSTDSSFLGAKGQSLSGYLLTADAVAGVYSTLGVGLISYLSITNISDDKTDNYEITVSGEYEIIEGVLKTLVISKTAILNKDNQVATNINTAKFVIRYLTNDISNTGVYNIEGNYFNIINENNSNSITISTNAEFNGNILISSVGFNYTVGSYNTIAVGYKWIETGINDVLSTNISYAYSSITENVVKNITIQYINFSTIHYFTRFSLTEQSNQTVYNTQNGITISHVDGSLVAIDGLEFLGWYDSTLSSASQIPTLWKGYGDVNVFAKWNVLKPQVNLFDDETAITNSVSRVYDALTHSISAVVENFASHLVYTYSYKVNGQEISNTAYYTYKNVTNQSITLTVKADLYYDGVLYQSNTTTKTITLTVSKYAFTYDQEIEKVYDGTLNINVEGNNYIIVPIVIGTQTELLKLSGLYSSKFAGQDIVMNDMTFSDYSIFKKDNYDPTITSKGKITQRIIEDANIGTLSENYKVYDGLNLQITKTSVVSTYLVNGDLLDITFRTTNATANIYDATNDEIEIVSWTVWDSSRTTDITSSYDLTSIVGTARITNYEILMQDILFENASVVYNGVQRYVYAVFNTFANGIVPSDVEIIYTWKRVGDANTYSYPLGPTEVGTYLVTMTINADEINYTIVGANSKSAELTITAKPLTVYIQNNTYYGQGIKSVTITNASATGLVQNHTISGYIETNSNLPETYSQTNLNLVLNLSIKDSLNEEKITNYAITVNGSITIQHYYFIEYNGNGGTGAVLKQQLNYDEEKYISYNAFIKNGYEYSHWNTKADGTGASYAENVVIKNLGEHGETITLYAIWTPATNTRYYVYHYLQNIDLSYPETQNEISTLTNTTENYIEFVPVYNGEDFDYYIINAYKNGVLDGSALPYTKSFTGFTPSIDNSVLEGFVTPESQGALIIKIYYTRNLYEATFYKNNFENPNIINQSYLFEQEVEKPQDPLRDGYQFIGWYFNYGTPDQTLVTFDVENPFIMPANNVVFMAIYEAHEDTLFYIEFYEQNVDGTYPTTPTSNIAKTGTTDSHAFVDFTFDGENITSAVLRVFDDINRTNQIGEDYEIQVSYKGFYLAEHEDQIISGIVIGDGSLTLKLYYEREIYSLTKNFHNSASDTTSYYYYMAEVAQPATPTYTGYIFDGWYSNYDDETGYSGKITWPINMLQTTTIHAKWLPSNNTLYTVNIFFETLSGTYPQTANDTRLYTNTTNYYVEIINELYQGKLSNVLVIFDSSKVTRKSIETTFDYIGYHINTSISTLNTDILPNGSGVINIYFERDLYQVKYVYNNGDPDTYSSQVKYEQTITKPTDPTFVGYVFAGWYLDSTFVTPVNWPYKVINNTTVMYAKWNNSTDTEYKIETYKQDEEGLYSTLQSEIYSGTTGHYIVVEQEYVVDTYIWYLREYDDNIKTTLLNTIKTIEITGYTYDQNGEIIEKEIAPDGSMVIKLYYTLNSYDFTFEANNGEQSTIQSVYFNAKPILPTNPEYTGFVFAGWYGDIALTTEFNIGSFYMPAHNVTVYAKWSPAKDTAYKIEYYLQNLDLTYNATPYDTQYYTGTTNQYILISDIQIITYETSSKLTQLSAEGIKVFIGFSKATNINQNLEGNIDRLGNLVLKVYLQRNTYSIIFNYNSTQEQKQISGVLYESVVSENIPTKLGYTFAGWYYENTLNTKATWQINQALGTMEYTMEAKDIELFAKWSANNNTQYVVEHYLQNANNNDYMLYETKQYTGITDTIANAQTLTYLGFVFDNANVNNVLSGTITGDGELVLKVYYNRAIYKLTFNGNASTSGSMADIDFKYGQTQILPVNSFARTGYTFKGWTDVEGGIVVKYANQSPFAFLKAQNINLFALWQLNALDTAELTVSTSNEIYYGDETVLQVNASHMANVIYSYEWYYNGNKITYSSQTLTINTLSQSGTYKVLVFAQGVVSQGAQSNLTTLMTNEQSILVSPRPIFVEFGVTTFTYNAENQNPTYEIKFYVNEDEQIGLPTLNILVPSSTFALYEDTIGIVNSKNVGTYSIVVSLEENENFVVVGDTEIEYQINKLDWDISTYIISGEFSKDYAYPASSDPNLEKSIKNEDTNEEILITFERQSGEDVGFYDLILTQASLDNLNYNITLNSNNMGFEIKKVLSGISTLSFISTTLLSKTYDGELIDVANLSAFALENLSLSMGATLLSASFQIRNNSKNVGTYEIVLLSATSVEYENIEMESQYYFIIRQRSVELVSSTIVKVYDQTTTYNNLEMTNVISADISSLSLVASFTTASANINIPLIVTLGGEAKSNYKLGDSFTGLSGTILPRQIKIISSTNLNYIYGSFNGFVAYQAFGLNENSGIYDIAVDMSQVSGLLAFDPNNEKFSVGIYETTIGTVATTLNYQIVDFENGVVEITPKEIQAIADWNKYYDGLTTFDKEIELLGVFVDDDIHAVATYQSAQVGQLIAINLILIGDDNENYTLQNDTVYGNIEYKYVSALLDYAFDSLLAPSHSTETDMILQLIYNKTIAESGYLALPTPWATGYIFVGWFDEFDNEFTPDTLISRENWSEDATQKNLTAKWSIGTVNLTVNVITYSSTNYVIEQMNMSQLVSGTFTINTVDYLTGGNVKAVEFGQNAFVEVVPNEDYEFVGWYLSTMANALAISSNETFTVEENLLTILMNNNITIYAKFKLKTAVVTLYANSQSTLASITGDYLNWEVVWDGTGFSSIYKQFDFNTVVLLPTNSEMLREGYYFVGWSTSSDGAAEYTEITISQDIELYAVWEAKSYTATFVASTGADETGLLHADKGHFENPTNIEDNGLWEKEVFFEQVIGTIQEPLRDRYTFVGWYDNADLQGLAITSESVYLLTQNQTYYAKWIEQTYIVVLTVEKYVGGQTRIEQSSGVLSVVTQISGTKQIFTIQLLSTATLEIYVTQFVGYELSYSHAYTVGTDFNEEINILSQEAYIDITRFNQNLNLNIAFKSILQEITFIVPNTLFGLIDVSVENFLDSNLRAESISDEGRVVSNVIDNQQIVTVYAYTDERISINILPVMGYELSGLHVYSGSGQFGEINLGITKFVGFNTNCTASVMFTESTHSISLKIGKDVSNNEINSQMGSFGLSIIDKLGNTRVVEENISNEVNLLNITVKTDEKLVMTANAFHGFVLSQNDEDYIYAKQNLLGFDGDFNLDNIDLGIIEFSNFNCGGEINLPYLRDLFTVQFKIGILDNEEFNEITENISNYIETQILTSYDKYENEIEYYNYEKILSIKSTMAYGYKFVGWFEELNQEALISKLNTYTNYKIVDNMTIYAVIEYDTFIVSYSIDGNGYLAGENLVQEIKYNHDGQSVTAIADEGYEFSHWEVYNSLTSSWEIDEVNTGETRQELLVNANMSIKAVFVASQIEISFKSLYITGRDLDNNYIFSDEMSEDIGTIAIYDSTENGFEFTYLTQTAEIVRVLANAHEGFSVIAWMISQNSKAYYIENNGLNDIELQGFTEDFTITAIFDSNTNIFSIAFVKPIGNDYNYNSSQYISGGVITIDPSLYLQTQPYQDKVEAAVRTKQAFEVVFQIAKGYTLIIDQGVAKVGIRFANESDIIFADNVVVTELSGMYNFEVTFIMDNFYKGGEIVLFVEEEEFDVTFYKTSTEYKVFELNINSTFSMIDSDYKLPSRTGYIFEGWFSSTSGQGVQYIDSNGNTIREWEIEHTSLYANWSRAFITYTLQYIPSTSVADGPLGWNVQENELKRVVNATTYQYYVGITTYFQAQSGLDGYIFSHWAKNGEVVSTNYTYIFDIAEDDTTFNQTLQIVYKVRHAVNSTVGGAATISGQNYVYLLQGQLATLEATPKAGYDFVGWRIQGTSTILSAELTYQIEYNSHATVYTAVFEGKRVEIIILTTQNGSVTDWKVNGGSPIIDENKKYARLGDFVTFETNAETGYLLTGWEINGILVAKFDYYEIKMADVETAGLTFKPIFSLVDISYEISFPSSGEVKINNQAITSGRTFVTNYFSNITFTFIANIRYTYKQITINGIVLDAQYVTVSGNTYSVNLPANILSLTAVNRILLSFDRLFWQDKKIEFGGLGTENNPYIISSAENFAHMAYLINNEISVNSTDKIEYASAYYMMFASVDFADRFWTPIGTEENPFNGIIRLDYERRNIFLDANYTVIHYDGLFGYITDNAQFLREQPDITTGIIIFSSVGATLIGIVALFSIKAYQKRKRLREQSRIFPTERPIKKG